MILALTLSLLALQDDAPARALPLEDAERRYVPVTGHDDARLAPLDEALREFVRRQEVPGLAVAVALRGRLRYARGFGYADLADEEGAVQPDTRFRIPGVSQCLTAVAILQQVELGTLTLEDRPFEVLGVDPNGPEPDPRIDEITVQQLLEHSGGFDSGLSGDPMDQELAIARALDVPAPASPLATLEYVAGRPLDFAPGSRSADSAVGYSALGQFLEHVTGEEYEEHVRETLLAPLGIFRMRLGRSLRDDQARAEACYYVRHQPRAASVFDGTETPLQYGGFCLEHRAAHDGWIGSAVDLVRFASALDRPQSVGLGEERLQELLGRPPHTPRLALRYLARGFWVQPEGRGLEAWQSGVLPGSSALLVRNADDLAWAMLSNTDRAADGTPLGEKIAPLLRAVVQRIESWPEHDLFPLYLSEADEDD